MSDSPGISVLIPVYNYDVRKLVEDLSGQFSALTVSYEIRCYDDQSHPSSSQINASIGSFPNTVFKVLKNNIGRSAIRNLLAREAKYRHLLFIDADSRIVSEKYLSNYLKYIETQNVIAGGTIYEGALQAQYSLRYVYGKNREQIKAERRAKNPYQYVTLNNLFIPKNVFLHVNLDESIKTYGHEDTKFGYSLRKNNFPVLHIDNPVEHVGLETNNVFLEKTREGIRNFYKILLEGYGLDSKLCKAMIFLKKYRLEKLFCFYYTLRKDHIEKNLHSASPSLFYFDLYKLYLLLSEEKSSSAKVKA